MKWYHGLEPITEENVSLAAYTWFRLGGSARYFCTPTTTDQVSDIVRRAAEHALPLKVLGGGANVLVRDEGFEGIVLYLSEKTFGGTIFDDHIVRAGGAADLPDLVRRTVDRGLAGLECLAGIPGKVGGSVRMNAGGKFGAIGQQVKSVRTIGQAGELRCWNKSQLSFDYRRTNLANEIIIEAVFELSHQDAQSLSTRYKEIWDYKKSTQPFTRNNAGCIFKNPTSQAAGDLIDRAGLKGETCGGASVCQQHANFIVAHPHTSTHDILTLVDRIQRRVSKQFAVDLELEVDVW